MFDHDKWQEIFHAMTMNKLRTFLTGLGVSWGVFMLLILMGAGSGLEGGAKADFGNYATNRLIVWTQRTTIPYKGLPKGRVFKMENEDEQAIMDNVNDIVLAAPQVQLGGYSASSLVSRERYSGSYAVTGEVPEVLKILPREMIAGRFLNQNDLDERRKVTVIGKRVRDVLFEEEENPIGKNIKISGIFFKVIGVYDVAMSGQNSESELEKVFIPISTFQNAFNSGNKVNWYNILANDKVSISELEPKILAVLKARHKVHPDDDRAFGFWNAGEEMEKINGVFLGISILVWFVGIGTLLAGVIGVSNIMLVVVKERTKEIGVRKALGATPWSVVSQVVSEAVFLTTVAGGVGLIAGVALVEGARNYLVTEGIEIDMFSNPHIVFDAAFYAVMILIFSGGLAGMLPAIRAASVNPIAALRGS